MLEKVIISLIAVSQLALSVMCVMIGMVYYPPWLIYGLVGAISAFVLFFPGVMSKIISLAWHLLFVGYMFVNTMERRAATQTDEILSWWAVIDLAAIFYLARMTLGYVRKRKKSQLGGL